MVYSVFFSFHPSPLFWLGEITNARNPIRNKCVESSLTIGHITSYNHAVVPEYFRDRPIPELFLIVMENKAAESCKLETVTGFEGFTLDLAITRAQCNFPRLFIILR